MADHLPVGGILESTRGPAYDEGLPLNATPGTAGVGAGGWYPDREGRKHMAVRVLVKNNEPLDKTLKRLRKICNNEGITREIKRTSVYEKPSERRRRKERERIKAIRSAKKKSLKAATKKRKRPE
jgi:small subunit ribosomal protein S21